MHQDFCFHIHTARCGHTDKSLQDENTILQFIESGYKSIAFTDHCPWKDFLKPFNPGHAMEWNQLESYFETTRELGRKYKDRIEVITGLEMEYLPGHTEEMKELTAMSDIVVIGQHYTYSKKNGYTGMHKKGFVPNNEELDFYSDALVGACEDKYVTILAHPDLYMVHKTEFGKKEEEVARKICSCAEKHNIPVEINLCQISKNKFFQPCGEPYPRREFWEIASEYKLKVLYGLDYHGYFPVTKAEEAYFEADRVIGEDILSKLNFIKREQIENLHP